MKHIKLIPIGGYYFFLFIFSIIISYGVALLIVPDLYGNGYMFHSILMIILLVGLPTALIVGVKDQLLVILYLNQLEIFEKVLLNTKRYFQWDEVVDVGIGVNPIQAHKNVNFYVSRRPVKEYEVLHVLDMRKDPDVIMIRYSKKAYRTLKTFCPIEIKQEELIPQIDKSIIK